MNTNTHESDPRKFVFIRVHSWFWPDLACLLRTHLGPGVPPGTAARLRHRLSSLRSVGAHRV